MRFCIKCGSQIIDDNADFCSSCGEKIIKESTTQSTPVTTFTPAISSNGIVLPSPEPIPHVLKESSGLLSSEFGSILVIMEVLGIGLEFTDSYYMIGRYIWGTGLVGIFIFNAIHCFRGTTDEQNAKLIKPHLDEIREIKFKFLHGVSASEIYAKIAPAIKNQYGDKFEFDRQNETVSVIHEKIIFKIVLNDDGTFCIWWTRLNNESISKIDTSDLYDIYTNVLSCTAIIAYELQQQFGIN